MGASPMALAHHVRVGTGLFVGSSCVAAQHRAVSLQQLRRPAREEFLCPHGDLPEKRCRGRAGFYQDDVDTRGPSSRLGIDHIRDPRRKHFQFCIFPGSGVSKVRLRNR